MMQSSSQGGQEAKFSRKLLSYHSLNTILHISPLFEKKIFCPHKSHLSPFVTLSGCVPDTMSEFLGDTEWLRNNKRYGILCLMDIDFFFFF